MKEKSISFNSKMVNAILEGRKTQTRKPVKEPLIYSLTDDRIYGKLTINKEVYYESRIKENSNFSKSELQSRLRWADLFTYEIHGIWEKGVRGLVSIKRTQYEKRIQCDFFMPQQQKNNKISSQIDMYGISRDASEKIFSGQTFGWQPEQQQAEQFVLGDTRGQLEGQESSRQRNGGGETPNGEIDQYRMRAFEVGNKEWSMQPASSGKSIENDTSRYFSYCKFQINQILWVREKHRLYGIEDLIYCEYADGIRLYVASNDYENPLGKETHWRSSICMPRWASRITLEITDVRVERLQNISLLEAKKEGLNFEWEEGWTGCIPLKKSLFYGHEMLTEWKNIWNSIYKKHPWESNPWVFVIEFKKI